MPSLPADAGSTPFVHHRDRPWEPVGDGLERQILGWDGGLMMVRVRFAEGAVGALHHHPHRQATYVASGVFEVEVGGATATLRAGDGFFARPDVEHGVVALEAGELIDVFAPAREDFVG